MKFNDDTRTRILADVTLTIDPAGSTPEVKVDGTWYAATWQGAAVHIAADSRNPERWTQTARSTGYFAGPAAVASGATVLAVGRHPTEVRVTSGSDIIVGPSDAIDVY